MHGNCLEGFSGSSHEAIQWLYCVHCLNCVGCRGLPGFRGGGFRWLVWFDVFGVMAFGGVSVNFEFVMILEDVLDH